MDKLIDLNALPLEELFGALNPPERMAEFFAAAKREEVGEVGVDVTSELMIDATEKARATIIARERGVVCGAAAIPPLLRAFGASITMRMNCADGSTVRADDAIGVVEGSRRELLLVERTMLNVIGRLSGIATLTAEFVSRIAGTGAKLFDTRKMTPGMRGLEKYAVRCGGGFCHRHGLHDAVLVKDNHLAGVDEGRLTTVLTERLESARRRFALRFVEVEVETLEGLEAVLACPAGLIDIVLLDNMGIDQWREAVRRRNARRSAVQLEASGGVRLETVGAIARTGVERISAGAITHSAKALDVALEMQT